MIEYPQHNKIPGYFARYKIAEFLLEDIPEGDITTVGILKKKDRTTAVIQAEEDLVFCGEQILSYFFDDSFELDLKVHDSDRVQTNDEIARINGATIPILTIERVMLNLLQRLCGIATLTSKFVEIAKPYNVRILDTRKTTPGLRIFEKYAVNSGGGFNHRMDLSSGILIKDNHIKAAGGIANAIKKIKERNYKLPLEIEVENTEQIKEAMEEYVDGILLDNMSPAKIIECVKLIRSFSNGDGVFIEASGGINLNTIADYVKTGVDAISVGSLTHSAKGVNIHLEFL